MYGLIGKMLTAPGKRDEFIAILVEGTGNMPGCLSYIVAKDPADANAIWITEVWDSETSHAASLSLPEVTAAIAKGKPLIAADTSTAMIAFKAGQRPGTIMDRIAKGFSDEEIQAIAQWYAGQK